MFSPDPEADAELFRFNPAIGPSIGLPGMGPNVGLEMGLILGEGINPCERSGPGP